MLFDTSYFEKGQPAVILHTVHKPGSLTFTKEPTVVTDVAKDHVDTEYGRFFVDDPEKASLRSTGCMDVRLFLSDLTADAYRKKLTYSVSSASAGMRDQLLIRHDTGPEEWDGERLYRKGGRYFVYSCTPGCGERIHPITEGAAEKYMRKICTDKEYEQVKSGRTLHIYRTPDGIVRVIEGGDFSFTDGRENSTHRRG